MLDTLSLHGVSGIKLTTSSRFGQCWVEIEFTREGGQTVTAHVWDNGRRLPTVHVDGAEATAREVS